jgi:hypothetical protein
MKLHFLHFNISKIGIHLFYSNKKLAVGHNMVRNMLSLLQVLWFFMKDTK